MPEDVPSESQPALSLADQDKALPVVFVSTTDALVPLLPKSTWTGETYSLVGFPVSEETSTGDEELQAAETTRQRTAEVARRTCIGMNCTAVSREAVFLKGVEGGKPRLRVGLRPRPHRTCRFKKRTQRGKKRGKTEV